MRVLRLGIFSLLILGMSGGAQAQVLSTFVREQVGSLPKGRFMVSYFTLSSSIDSAFGDDGAKKALSSNLSQSVTFQKITQQDPVRGNQLAGLFLSNGVNLSDSAGALSGVIQGQVSGKIPVVGYGLTDDLGVYVSIPVLNFAIDAAYQFTPSARTGVLLSNLSANDQASVAQEMNAALNTSLESKLYQSGFVWDPHLNRNYIGDVQVMVMKVLPVADRGRRKQSLQASVVLPTASDQDIHDLYGLKAGDRRLGFGGKYSLEQALPGRFQVNLGVSGTYLFSNVQARRVPRDGSDALNENLDPNTQVSGGAKFAGQAQIRYSFPKWLALNAGALWQKRMEETLEGSLYTPFQYDLASWRSSYDLVSGYASLDLNSIPAFLEGNFLFPAVAEVGVGLPLFGRNAISEPVFQLQGTMFF